MTILYPEELDSDLTLPRVDDNITEIRAETINPIRDAVLTIEKTLGTNPQGNLQDLDTRINISIDSDGNIKSSALAAIGLVTLPIYDAQIATNANIQETKLALAYNTPTLKSLIDVADSDISSLQGSLNNVSNTLHLHIFGIDTLDFRHDGYQININTAGTAGLAGLGVTTIGDAVNEFDGYLLSGNKSLPPHLEIILPSPMKHVARNIQVDTSNFTTISRSATDVQAALESIDASTEVVLHVEDYHSNGVFNKIVSGTLYNSQKPILIPDIVSYTEGYDGYGIVSFQNTTSFDGYVKPGDILFIYDGYVDSGSYQINMVGPLSNPNILGNLPSLNANQLSVFCIFRASQSYSDKVHAQIFAPILVSSEACPLACAVRDNGSVADTISILHPQAARVKSLGFDGTILAADGYHLGISVGVGNGIFRTIDIPDLQLYRLSLTEAYPVDAKSVSERINAYVSDPSLGFHFPITAYRVGDELAIAHNWVGPDYTIEILDGYSGNFALGFDQYGANVDGYVISGNLGANYSVGGHSLSDIEQLFDGYTTLSSPGNSFNLHANGDNGAILNPLDYSIVQGSVIHISGHSAPNANGSYTALTSNSSFVTLFETIPAGTFDIMVSSADISLSILSGGTNSGIIQIYVDNNQNTLMHQRLVYNNAFGSSFEIINVSDGFPEGDAFVYTSSSPGSITFYMVVDTFIGLTATIQSDFVGSFKLYHPNNLDYITINMDPNNGPFTVGPGFITVTVVSPLPDDEALLLCTAFFNSELNITNIIDNRMFGNLGIEKIRSDTIEFLSQRPLAELRSDGVVRGFDLADAEYFDSITGMQAVPLTGGVAYVDGVRIATDTQKVILQSFDSSSSLITANKIIGINELGTIQELDYSLETLLIDGYDGYETAFGRVLPLFYVPIINGLIDKLGIIDIRRFINNLDDKIELIVDGTQNNLIGTFTTLEGALLYAQNYPSAEKLTIKIVGSVFPSMPLSVPSGVSIVGSTLYGSSQQIIGRTVSGPVITLNGNNRLENIKIISSPDVYSVISVAGSNINIEKCFIGFSSSVGSNAGCSAVNLAGNFSNVRIVDSLIDTVYNGISSTNTIQNLLIDGNAFTNVSGIGTSLLPSCAINLACADQYGTGISISNNTIAVSASSSSADIKGIYINLADAYGVNDIRIINNYIQQGPYSSGMSDGIRVLASSSGRINNLVIRDGYISGVNLADNKIYGIYCSGAENIFINHNTISYCGAASVSPGFTNNYGIYVADGFSFSEVFDNTLLNCDFTTGISVAPTGTPVSGPATISSNNLISIGTKCTNGIQATGQVAGNYGFMICNNTINSNSGVANQLINTVGDLLSINGNRLSSSVNSTYGILFSGTSGAAGISVIGNIFNGTITNSIYGAGTPFTKCTLNSNASTTSPTSSIHLPYADASCLIVGNNFYGAGGSSVGAAFASANLGV